MPKETHRYLFYHFCTLLMLMSFIEYKRQMRGQSIAIGSSFFGKDSSLLNPLSPSFHNPLLLLIYQREDKHAYN